MALLHDPHPPQIGQVGQFGAEGGGLSRGLRDQGDGAGVLEDPAGLEGGGGRVDGHGDQSRRPGGEVEDGPFVEGAGHDGDAVARHQALGDQSLGDGHDLGGELPRRHLAPAAVRGLPAEHHRVRLGARVLERQVGERAVAYRPGERRYGRLPYDSVQLPGLGRDQDGCSVHLGVEGGGGMRGGHGRLLGRAVELLAATTYVPRTPRRSPVGGCVTGLCGDRTATTWGVCAGRGVVPGRACAMSRVT